MAPLTFKEKISLFYWYHSFVKWILRFITGRCELERICYNIRCTFMCNLHIEMSLKSSKSEILNNVLTTANTNVQDSVQQVLQVKQISAEKSLVFVDRLSKSLTQILGYIDLMDAVDKERKIMYSSENKEHEEKLLELWSLLMPNTPLENRISNQWSEIGFQGKNPQTDFRGMGILGLENLLYFAKIQNNQARKVLSESHHPTYWYSYAIVGINISELTCRLLKSGVLKTHFYNGTSGKPTMEDFHKVYCYLFREFSAFWIAQRPASVMEFNRIREEFEGNIITTLQNSQAVFDVDVPVRNSDVHCSSLQSLSSVDLT